MNNIIDYISARTPMELILMAICIFLAIGWVISSRLNFFLGVNDGYGYAREPWNPGYKTAGRWLRKHAAYRWPELKTQHEALPDNSVLMKMDPD